MLVIFAGVVLSFAEASSVAGDPLGAAWRTLVSVLVFMLLSRCTAAAAVMSVLHTLRRSGVQRLENINSLMNSVESSSKR
jgi:hypothetical protein